MRLTVKIGFAHSTSEWHPWKEQGTKSSVVKGKAEVSSPGPALQHWGKRNASWGGWGALDRGSDLPYFPISLHSPGLGARLLWFLLRSRASSYRGHCSALYLLQINQGLKQHGSHLQVMHDSPELSLYRSDIPERWDMKSWTPFITKFPWPPSPWSSQKRAVTVGKGESGEMRTTFPPSQIC